MSQFSHTQKHTLTIQPSLMPWLFDAAVSTAVVRPTNSQGKVVQGWDVFMCVVIVQIPTYFNFTHHWVKSSYSHQFFGST